MKTVLKRGRRKLSKDVRRVKISPTVAPTTVEALTTIMLTQNESRGEALDRLVVQEAKRLVSLGVVNARELKKLIRLGVVDDPAQRRDFGTSAAGGDT